MNSSNLTSYSSPYARLDWQIAQILWVGYFTVTAYLFIALVLYLIRYRKEKQLRRKRGVLMYMFVLLAFVFAVVEMGINEWGILHMVRDEATCKSWRQVHHLAFITSLVPGYIFLWIRQHAFYQDAMLRTLTTKCVRIFSYCVLSTLFVGYGFFVVFFGTSMYTKTHEYIVLNQACYSGKHKNLSMVNYGIASILLVFYQGSLLFLFTYPIWKSNKEDGEQSETMAVVMSYMTKCRNLTILTSATDILAFLCASFFKKIWNAPLHLLTCVYDIDLLINLFCLLMCLKPWKEIVLPFRTRVRRSYTRDISYVNSGDRRKNTQVSPPEKGHLLNSGQGLPRRESVELASREEENGTSYLNEFPLSPLEEKRLSYVDAVQDNRASDV